MFSVCTYITLYNSIYITIYIFIDADKPHYDNKDIAGDIYLKIIPVTQDFVQVCGSLGESLKHTTFFMDLHAAEDETKDLSNYSFENRDKMER